MEDPVDGLALVFRDAEKEQPDGIAARIGIVIARHFLAGGPTDSQFLFQFTGERLLRLFIRFQLAAGQLPLQGMRLFFLAPPNENLAFALNDRRHHLHHGIIGT